MATNLKNMSVLFSRSISLSSNKARYSFLRIQRLFSSSSENEKDQTSKAKISKAMQAYLQRAKAHEEFMKQETHQFNIGRRHLANMMGADPEHFTQEDIDKSIQYLLPSGLFEPKARPIMKPPEEVFPKTKAAEFDESGRPYHHLFYTSRPHFSSLLHKCADLLEELDIYEDEMIRQQRKPDSSQSINLMGSSWLIREQLEKQVLEKLVDIEYNKFVAAMDRIATHPYGYRCSEFIYKYRVNLMEERVESLPQEPQKTEDGRMCVTVPDCVRKSTRGSVTLTVPGTGKFTINNKSIDYFKSDVARNQIGVIENFKRKLNLLANRGFS